MQKQTYKMTRERRQLNEEHIINTRTLSFKWPCCDMHICRQRLRNDKRAERLLYEWITHKIVWFSESTCYLTDVPLTTTTRCLNNSTIYFPVCVCICIYDYSILQSYRCYRYIHLQTFTANRFSFIIISVTLCRARQQQTILIRSY